jgi:hypothetical protein
MVFNPASLATLLDNCWVHFAYEQKIYPIFAATSILIESYFFNNTKLT